MTDVRKEKVRDRLKMDRLYISILHCRMIDK
jgi:hypothetical protein